ncbi:molybdenum cofactor biosynthesis protein MoaE [Paracoccus sp. PXZ]
MAARVQSAPFDLAAELAGFGAGSGAVVTFTGLVRDEGGRLVALEIEHYPGMTEKALQAYGEQAAQRFALDGWRIVHRHGRLAVGEPIMMVATAARKPMASRRRNALRWTVGASCIATAGWRWASRS